MWHGDDSRNDQVLVKQSAGMPVLILPISSRLYVTLLLGENMSYLLCLELAG